MTKRLLFLALFATSTAFADVTITSVSPSSGPNAGGTRVTVKGTGFSNNCIICSPPFAPPRVLFGGTPAAEVTFIDAATLEVVTPVSLPRTVSVTVINNDGSGSATKQSAFSYVGNIFDTFEPLLFPVFSPPVLGAFQSDFRTFARVFPAGPESPILLYGQDVNCLPGNPPRDPWDPVVISDETTLAPDCSTSMGRLFWVRKGTAASLAANLRVADVSRQATSHGTQIPVLRAGDFKTDTFALLGVPNDPRFRVTLRIYCFNKVDHPVRIRIDGMEELEFVPDFDLFKPGYVEVRDLPRNLTRVVIRPAAVPLWAFITVTNNDTQQITTITPQ